MGYYYAICGRFYLFQAVKQAFNLRKGLIDDTIFRLLEIRLEKLIEGRIGENGYFPFWR